MRSYKSLLQNIIFNSKKELPLSFNELELEIAKEIFREYGYFLKDEEWNIFLNNLESKYIKKLTKLVHFYFFLCREKIEDNNIEDEIVLITITSIIEDLMSDFPYKEFNKWYKSECKKEFKKEAEQKDSLDDMIFFLWEEYKKHHGAARKVVKFFESYIDKIDEPRLTSSIEVYNKKINRFEKCTEIKQIARLLYQMRSDFVHEAKIKKFKSEDSINSLYTKIGKKSCDLDLSLEDFIDVFEKAFINFFISKAKEGEQDDKMAMVGKIYHCKNNIYCLKYWQRKDDYGSIDRGIRQKKEFKTEKEAKEFARDKNIKLLKFEKHS